MRIVNKKYVFALGFGIAVWMASFASAGTSTGSEARAKLKPVNRGTRKPTQIMILKADEDLDTSTLEKDGTVLNWSQYQPPGNRLPSVEVREQAFTSAQLQAYVGNWDDSDKDLLYIRARSIDLQTLQATYPDLPPEGLRSLMKIIRSSP